MKDKKYALKLRWAYLAVGAFCMLFLGVPYAWSIFKLPLEQTFHWEASALALNYTLTSCMLGFSGLIGSWISRRLNLAPNRMILIAAVLFGTGFFICSRLDGRIWQLYLGYGLMAGGAIGMAYNALITIIMAWFPDKRGTSSGVMMMSFGLSAVWAGRVMMYLFELEGFGWRKTCLLFGGGTVLVMVLAGLILRLPEAAVLPESGKSSGEVPTKQYMTAEMVRRPSFIMFFMFGVFYMAVGMPVIAFCVDLVTATGAAIGFAAAVNGLLSLFNGFGRLLCGTVYDWLGRKKTMLLVSAVNLAAPVLIGTAITVGSPFICVVGICLAGIAYGSYSPLDSAYVSEFYGTWNFSSNYGVMNLMMLPASCSPTLIGVIIGGSGGYGLAFILLVLSAAAAMVLALCIKRP